GDGVTQPAMGEQCDEGEALNGSPGHCRANCVSPFCGDGVVDPWEECEGSADGCDPTSCTICGNGNVSGNEQCDPPGGGCPDNVLAFTSPGTIKWTAPSYGVDATMQAYGASGGGGYIDYNGQNNGGRGGYAAAVFPVTPGTSYQIV